MEIKKILAKLEGVTPTTNGWQGRCPIHDDDRPSLSIADDEGKLLIHCHAGCSAEDIVKSLGLHMQDLFPEKHVHVKPTVIATYPYEDEDEELGYQIQRLKPKGFRARQPDGNGGWIYNLAGC